MVEKIKKNKCLILELIIIFILTLLFNLLCNGFERDEMWNYGFAYNIASGLIPYKDFNMVITPLFPILGALFLSVFGKNILVYYTFNSIICTALFYYIKKYVHKNYYLVYIIVLFFSTTNYNLLCLLLLYIVMDMEDRKSNDYLIGIILGLTFLTKQNIGIYLCIPTLFLKDIKRIFKRGIGFIIPIFIMLVYLLLNDCIYEFIDYVFLGITDFVEKNTIVYKQSLIIHILTITYLIYKYIKTKDIKLVYILCFQGMAYPIFNDYHIIIPFIPAFAYFIDNIRLNVKIINSFFIVIIAIVFSINIYQLSTDEYNYPNNTINYKYKKLPNNIVDSVNILTNYLEKTEGNVYIIDIYAYLLKLESSLQINKYDLLNNGNLGKGGYQRIISEIDGICQKEKCTFLLNENRVGINQYDQYSQELYLYIINKYKKKEKIKIFTIYKNYD